MSFSATPFRARRARPVVTLLLSAALLLGVSPLAAADPSADPSTDQGLPTPTEVSTTGNYIVALADAPIAAYDGAVAGYDATQPSDGESVDIGSADAKRYRSYLRGRQDRAAGRVGSKPQERYEVGVNAFTARMTGRQAATLARTDGVLSVTKDTLRKVRDDRKSVDFLGLSGHHGVWSKLGGADEAGRGVVVGMIDSGIWPESDSFAGEPLNGKLSKGKHVTAQHVTDKQSEPRRSGATTTMVKSDRGTFTGTCQAGEAFTVDDCNSKLIGARYFGDTWLATVPPGQRADFVSPRDGDGHGSHTASIAAGNHNVRAVVDDRDLGRISGVAPAAKIAAYKVLWQAKDATKSGAYDSDVIAAIDAAISDGVDVINFSVTSPDNPTHPVQLAFLAAASAGIFVATAAGNSGPVASTVQSTSPWVTTVGAHTIAPYYGTVTLGDGRSYVGVSTTVDDPVGPASLVNATAVVASGQTAANAAACTPNSLDLAKTAGRIVVCERGIVERPVKSAEVKRAGGIGMVLINPSPASLDGDLHSVPTVHVDPPASTDIKAYAADEGAKATLTEGNDTDEAFSYPQIAPFSARGPSLGTGGDTLKPDLVAPGVSILGAVAPPSNDNDDFGFMSGTSQSSPQVAGLAALWFGAGVQPKWSPMNVKSALMTTAADLVGASGRRMTDPYAQGAGRVVPDRMFSPGLVYPAGDRDWWGYLAGLVPGADTGVAAIDPSNYNSPSIAIGRLAGTQTVTRRVTAVTAGSYRVTASIPGVEVDVKPNVLNFSKVGQTSSFKVTFTRTKASLESTASGFLTWKSKDRTVRIPMVVTPRLVDAPAQVSARGSSRGVSFMVTPGTSGRFTATATGLATGPTRPIGGGSLTAGKTFYYAVPVPAGTKVARFTVRSPNPAANLDLEVYTLINNVATLVGQSTSVGPDESYVLRAPEPLNDFDNSGNCIRCYALQVRHVADAPGTTSTPFTAQTGLAQPGSGSGNFAVTPTSTDATAGRPVKLKSTWSDLDDSTPFVGWIEYPNGQGTVVTVN